MEKPADIPIHQSLLVDRKGPVKSQKGILKSYTQYFDDVVNKLAPPEEEPTDEDQVNPHDPITLTKNLTQNIDSLSMLVESFGQELSKWMARQENQK